MMVILLFASLCNCHGIKSTWIGTTKEPRRCFVLIATFWCCRINKADQEFLNKKKKSIAKTQKDNNIIYELTVAHICSNACVDDKMSSYNPAIMHNLSASFFIICTVKTKQDTHIQRYTHTRCTCMILSRHLILWRVLREQHLPSRGCLFSCLWPARLPLEKMRSEDWGAASKRSHISITGADPVVQETRWWRTTAVIAQTVC